MSAHFSFVTLLIILLMVLFSAFRILREYERGVVFMLGRFYKVKGPGLIIIIPGIQKMVRVDLRTVVMDVPSQDVISRDNVSVKVSAVVYFRVVDPAASHHSGGEFSGRNQSICPDYFTLGTGKTRA